MDLKTASKRFQVRAVSRDQRFSRIRALTCFQEVYERVLAGWSMPEVAKFIQDDMHEYTDITRSSLIGQLNEFRSSIPRAELIQKRMPKAFHEAADTVREGLDELVELKKLYEMQMERIGIDYQTEKKINKLMPSMTQEIKEARQILESYAQLKMDLGLATRHLGQVDIDAHLMADVAGRYGKESVARVLGDPESRRRVLGIVERIAISLPVGEKEGTEDDKPVVDAVLDTADSPLPEESPESEAGSEPSLAVVVEDDNQ